VDNDLLLQDGFSGGIQHKSWRSPPAHAASGSGDADIKGDADMLRIGDNDACRILVKRDKPRFCLWLFSAMLLPGLRRWEHGPWTKRGLSRLTKMRQSVIVANPEHVSVTLDNPHLLILTPHAPGVTSMIVLDAAGKTILEQEIIVTNVQKSYVASMRMCSGNDASAAAQSYDYCPDWLAMR